MNSARMHANGGQNYELRNTSTPRIEKHIRRVKEELRCGDKIE